jgi:hypothetical protein
MRKLSNMRRIIVDHARKQFSSIGYRNKKSQQTCMKHASSMHEINLAIIKYIFHVDGPPGPIQRLDAFNIKDLLNKCLIRLLWTLAVGGGDLGGWFPGRLWPPLLSHPQLCADYAQVQRLVVQAPASILMTCILMLRMILAVITMKNYGSGDDVHNPSALLWFWKMIPAS